MQNYEITTDINPQYLDHFKSQLMHVEASGSEVKFLFDGGGFQDRHESMKLLLRRSFHDIVNERCPGVVRFWNELKASKSFNTQEFVDQYDSVNGTFLGIGVASRI